MDRLQALQDTAVIVAQVGSKSEGKNRVISAYTLPTMLSIMSVG